MQHDPSWLTARRAAIVVALITLVGLIPRLLHFDLSIIGDELSTLYVVDGRSLPDTISLISTDAEISPPLYFILAWITTHLGSAPELVRLPALIAGVATIPLAYLVGTRMVGRVAGVVAAAAMALNPFMVFYATDARAYTVVIALLLASTLAMLTAAQSGRTRWWVVYGALSCLAMYTHYTAAFILLAQLGWLLWAYPSARRPAILANLGAAVLYLPWVPSFLADMDSPTTDVLDALQGDGFAVKRIAAETWAFGYPGNLLEAVPGGLALKVGIAGVVLALLATVVRMLMGSREDAPEADAAPRHRRNQGIALALALALATPVAEAAILLLGGTDLFGARNLNTSSGGFALAIGALASGAGPWIGAACATAVLGAFAVGTVKSLDAERSTIDFRAAAELIDAESEPGDILIDSFSAGVTPVPLTPIDVFLESELSEYRLGLAKGPPPFLEETSPVPDPARLLRKAFGEAGDGTIFLVVPPVEVEKVPAGQPPALTIAPGSTDAGRSGLELALPEGVEVVSEHSYPGLRDVHVLEIRREGETGAS